MTKAFAQDKDDVAKALYVQAEEKYSSGLYLDAVSKLNEAEKTLGSTNSRILFLKANALNYLNKTNKSYFATLVEAVDKFFAITDKTNYPDEKYMDMVNISIEIREAQRKEQDEYFKLKLSNDESQFKHFFNDYPNSKYLTELRGKYDELMQKKVIEEKADYEKAIKINTIEAYKEFLDTYSYTAHYGDIQSRYDKLLKEQKENRHHRVHQ